MESLVRKVVKGLLPFYLFTFLPFSASAREAIITSPDGKLVVTINDNRGAVRYSATLDGQQVLLPSQLGFKADFGDFTHDLTITGTKAEQIDRRYKMRQAKQSQFHYVATQFDVDVENASGQKMTIQFHVADNNLAFRYLIPRQKKGNPKCAVILSEASSFRLPEGTTTFLTPQIDPQTGWERTKPSYEEEYVADAPLTAPSKYGQGYTFPCLFKAPLSSPEGDTIGPKRKTKVAPSGAEGGAIWLLISETGVSGNYCGSHLSDYKVSPLGGDLEGAYSIAFPQPAENNGIGSTTPGIPLPGETPWRTVTIGSTLKPIVEATIQYDLVEPLYEPSEQYQSGRYTWSWIIWQDESINWDDQVAFIDLAAAMGYEYCLVDGCWDTQIGRDRMPALSQYAQSKGVSLLLWYNSNGYWNDAPQTPRNCMDTAAARDREMAWMKSIGVKGIKVDFFGGDKQETMKLYEDILTDANRYGLQVIFHGCTLPRGWERMFPNFVASEAVLASENVYFTEHHAREEAFQLCMHPFCRNAVATMDWGGVMMNRYMSRDNRSRHQRQTTDMFEIASAFTNQTALQCVAMTPNNLDTLSPVELDFLKQLPTTWDETRFIDGYPGRYVVLARRHADHWYIAGLNALKEPLTLTLDLPMFAPGEALTLLNDAADKKTATVSTVQKTVKTDKQGHIKLTIQPNGGMVIYK